eukprot:TRINITY_DN38347_c0_g1_i1.p1 TRINITY_DN38347_c0_g1~~TRINITY_DN38347_c0_g1_i1.p1  ORF type:complete len:155 (-),score=9.81 TRINITY_DN38347_c0_g1_i1:260-724(-)
MERMGKNCMNQCLAVFFAALLLPSMVSAYRPRSASVKNLGQNNQAGETVTGSVSQAGGAGGGIPGFGNSGGIPGVVGNVPGVAGNGWPFAGPPPLDSGFAPSFVCTDRGPCYNKRLTCPSRCFKYSGRVGSHGGGGGGGGGCSFDCKHSCRAFC